MANGSHKEGPARADRFREEAEKHERTIQRSMDTMHKERDLPAYRESDSEITANRQGVHAKGIPRWAIGIALVLLAIPAGVLVLVLALRIAKVAGLIH